MSSAILALLAVVACGGPHGPAGAGPDAAKEDGEERKIDPAVLADKGPKVDLKNVSLTVSTSEPEALTMGTLFAFDKLRQWGAKVDEVTPARTSGIQTMIAGRSDLASHGADEVVLGRARGAQVTAIGSGRTKQVYVLVAKKGIDKVADLKGRTIAASGPSGFDTLLSTHALRNAGIKKEEARLARIGASSDRGAALVSGTVDAATVLRSDWENIGPRAKGLHVVEDFAETTDIPGDAYYMKTGYIQKNRDLALGIACANLEANEWINSHEQAYVAFTERHVKDVDPEGVKALWRDSQTHHYFPTSPAEVISPAGLTDLQKAMRESGDISGNASMAGAVDTSYLQKAEVLGCGS